MQYPDLTPMAEAHSIPDPETLIAGWQRLIATGAHLHLPQIAAHLGVPEAALLAARVGTGAVRLLPDLAKVLAPVCDWHRVLFVASTGLGVLMPMDDVDVLDLTDEHLSFSGPSLRGRLERAEVREIYLFEDHDPRHGTSKTIQIFDHGGAALLKLVLFHKPSFRAARDWTQALTHSDQTPRWQPGAILTPSFAALPAAGAKEIWQSFRENFTARVGTGQTLTIAAHRPGLDLSWTGTLSTSKGEGSALHLHEASLRAHLTLARAESGDGTALFVAGQELPALRILEGAGK